MNHSEAKKGKLPLQQNCWGRTLQYSSSSHFHVHFQCCIPQTERLKLLLLFAK